MRNIKLTLTYDGSWFYGFQRQPGVLSVQGELERVLELILQEKIKIKGAGRTDTNVHALGQVANFKTQGRLDLNSLRTSLNAHLAPNISVTAVEEVTPDFHSRFDAQIRCYHYYIYNEPYPHPFLHRFTLQVKKPLNVPLIQQGCREFTGEKNFASFTLANYHATSLVRTVTRFEVQDLRFKFFPFMQEFNFVRFVIEGSSFLPMMVRMMVGSLVRVGLERVSLERLKEIIASRGTIMGGPAVKACGLYLVAVKY